ncbi:MAG: hypothetical protein HRT82_07375 [Henriciella sp.]|nr:hypothetical protein [Henriciella sp.]
MAASPRSRPGLKLGFIVLACVALSFIGVFVFGPSQVPKSVDPSSEPNTDLLQVLTDAPTRDALAALKDVSPATYSELDALTERAISEGADTQAVSELVLEALFAQFQAQAGAIKGAGSSQYQSVMAGLANGFRQLEANDSAWCDGASIADFLAQNESDLVPTLLAEFPYASPQYDWAMGWMTTVLRAAQRGRIQPVRYARPGFRDEAMLQQESLALGSEQWALGLQIAAFANSEGTSYAKMQEVIGSMDVCELAIAVETVSERLPEEVRGRIWADLMPEIMIGNTPYVIYRVNDYFFIG